MNSLKPYLYFAASLFLFSACFEWPEKEYKVKTRSVKGRLLQSCDQPVPVAGFTLVFYTDNLVEAPREMAAYATTDSQGYFEFTFNSVKWDEGGRWDVYFAEIRDTSLSFRRFSKIIEGITPQTANVGNLYLEEFPEIDLKIVVDLQSIGTGDSLHVAYINKTLIRDTGHYTHSAKAKYLSEEGYIRPGPNGLRLHYWLSNDTSYNFYGERFFIPLQACTRDYNWNLSVPEEAYQ